MKSCFRLSLHSSHSAAITAFPSDHSTSWKQLSIISGLCHTQKACSTSLMVRRGWCGKDAACKWEEIRRNIWELGNDVFKWLVRPGWATNINNVCAQGLPNISWNLRPHFLFSITLLKQFWSSGCVYESTDKLIFHPWHEAAFST